MLLKKDSRKWNPMSVVGKGEKQSTPYCKFPTAPGSSGHEGKTEGVTNIRVS